VPEPEADPEEVVAAEVVAVAGLEWLVPAVVEPEGVVAAPRVCVAVLTADPAADVAVETADSGVEPGAGGGSVAACA
jgi:hypothetical protein